MIPSRSTANLPNIGMFKHHILELGACHMLAFETDAVDIDQVKIAGSNVKLPALKELVVSVPTCALTQQHS